MQTQGAGRGTLMENDTSLGHKPLGIGRLLDNKPQEAIFVT